MPCSVVGDGGATKEDARCTRKDRKGAERQTSAAGNVQASRLRQKKRINTKKRKEGRPRPRAKRMDKKTGGHEVNCSKKESRKAKSSR